MERVREIGRRVRRGAAVGVRALRGGSEQIYLLAPAGHPNYGDELILRAWLRTLAVLKPGVPVIVDCHTPGQAALWHRGTNPDAIFTDTVWRFVVEGRAEGLTDVETVDLVRSALHDRGTRPGLGAGIDALLRSTSVHVVGGGYLNANWPHQVAVAAAASEAAKISGARAIATGQGLIPVASSELLADALAEFDLVTVRDQPSLDVLQSLGLSGVDVRLVGDDAWLATARNADRGDLLCRDPDLAREYVLCVQSDLVGDDAALDQLVTAVEDTLEAWAVRGGALTVLEGIPACDYAVWERVQAGRLGASGALEGARFMPFAELWAAGLPARPGQTWLTTRFHPHLVAAAAGASGVALSVGGDYYATKHGSLVAAGSPWTTVTPSGAVPADPVAGGFPAAVVSARVAEAEGLAAEIYGRQR